MVAELAQTIAAHLDTWDSPLVEPKVFGTVDPAAIAMALDDLCRTHLGARVAAPLFYATSTGCVAGVVLEDERRVVIKAHPAGKPRERLLACARAQRALAAAGFPCPMPVLEDVV